MGSEEGRVCKPYSYHRGKEVVCDRPSAQAITVQSSLEKEVTMVTTPYLVEGHVIRLFSSRYQPVTFELPIN